MRTSVMGVAMVIAAMSRAVAADPSVCEPPTALVVLDRSSSMTGAVTPGGDSKWSAARAALDQMLSAYDQAIAFGLVTFPYPDACGAGRLEVPPGLGQRGAIGMALTAPPPALGNWTPLGETLMAVAEPAQIGGYHPDYVVVITDGFQWCDPYDPAQRELPRAAVKRLRDHGIRTFVVGFGGGVDEDALAAMAQLGGTAPLDCDPTGADPARPRCYHQADDAAALADALMAIAAHASSESCDGRDNDCDGVVDDGAPCAAGQRCTDGACVDLPAPGPDAGVAGADAGLDDGAPAGGCGCASAGAGDAGLGLALVVAWAQARRRRRGSIRPTPTTSASPAGAPPLP
ncbi:MAG: VWA domain-containing protein [Myxococcales bacterium]|nr:VWA domain-containing protein [Myxococcales bacterium]